MTGVPVRLDTGTEVQVSFGGIGPLNAEVRWSLADATGVKLATPLHSAIIDHFSAFVPVAG